MTRALYRNLTIIILIFAASNAVGAVDCNVPPWSVSDATELNEAIVCYNAKTVASNYTISVTQNIDLTNSSTAINNSSAGVTLLLEGNNFTVDGQDINGLRPFNVASGTTATFQNITITGGKINAHGGGILNYGTLTLNNCTISDNSADSSDDFGGGIYNNGALTVSNSTISNNTARSSGGGIYNNGALTVSNSTISNNTARSSGGGIRNQSTLIIESSTISNNLGGTGDGIYQNGSTLTINNSTLSGNTSTAKFGGGIFLDKGTTIINNSTLSGNFGGGGFAGNIYRDGGSVTLNNSILANSGNHNECQGTGTISGSNNLIQNSPSSCGLASANGNINGQDPLLGPLQDNGGPTFTHALLPGSPSLDSGDPTFPTTGYDQRGAGFDRVINSRLDMGAYEAAIYTLTVAPAGTGSGLISSSPAGINCGVDCTEAYHDGTEVTVTAVASAGSSFTSWAGACSGTGSCIATMTAARSVTANFTLNSYTITETANPTAGGSVSCTPNPVDHGSSASCSATANTGYTFDNWGGDCTGTGACDLSNVTGVRSVTANFTLNSYTITETASPVAGGSVSCSPNPVDHGSSTNCSATANTGYTFDNWGGDCTGTGACDLSNVTGVRSVTANFTLNSYTITETANPTAGGNVSCSPNPIDHGSNASCTASANTDYVFVDWAGDCTGTAACDLSNVTSVRSVTANFTIAYPVTMTIDPIQGGTVDCTPNPVPTGGTVSCSATPDPGFEFDHFSGDCSGQQCEITNVAGALSVTAVFLLLPVVPVPVISVWGLSGLAGLLALFGIGFSRRRA